MKKLLKQKGINQKKLATMTKIGYQKINWFVNGKKRLSDIDIATVADALQTTPRTVKTNFTRTKNGNNSTH